MICKHCVNDAIKIGKVSKSRQFSLHFHIQNFGRCCDLKKKLQKEMIIILKSCQFFKKTGEMFVPLDLRVV